MKRNRREIYVKEKYMYTSIGGLSKVNLKLYLLVISA